MKAKVAKLIALRRRTKFSGFLVPYAKEIEDFGGRPTRYGARALPGMPAASKRDARRRSAVSTRLRSCPNRRHLGGCCGAAAGGAATGRQIQRSGHPPAIHWKGTKAPLSAIHRRSSRLSKLATPSMRTSRRSWTRETSPPLSSRGTVHAGRHRTLRSTLAFIPPTPAGSAAFAIAE